MDWQVRDPNQKSPLQNQHRKFQCRRYFKNSKFFKIIFLISSFFINSIRADTPKLAFIQDSYKFKLNENNNLDQVLGQVSVNINNVPLEFIMHVNNGDKLSEKYFEMEKTSGKIRARRVFDSDADADTDSSSHFTDTYNFIVYCYDKKFNRKTEKPASITIQIGNLNDNKPKFLKSIYTFNITENREHGVFVGQVQATDKDRLKGRLEYRFVAPLAKLTSRKNNIKIPLSKLPFAIDHDGVITVDKTKSKSKDGISTSRRYLNREFNSRFQFYVYCSDTQHESHTKVIVNLTDENDNYPQFSKIFYNVTVSESLKIGTQIIKVSAYDKDIGKNGKINYSITSGDKNNKFEIGKDSGIVKLKNFLDHESETSYQLVLTARDNGKIRKANTTKLFINVLDENDHDPTFMESPYIINIKENARIGSLLTKVRALDQDSGNNGVIKYELDFTNLLVLDGYYKTILNFKDKVPLSLNSKTGELTLSDKLDREKISKYRFQIRAIDGANRSAKASVEINVENVNDMAPKFSNKSYDIKISEETKIGELLLEFDAEDYDLTDSKARPTLVYKIVSGNTNTDTKENDQNRRKNNNEKIPFYTSGNKLYLANTLKYKEKKIYNLKISVSDGELKSTADLNIQILAANIYKPNFLKHDFQFKIEENLPKGTFVGQVRARDEDLEGDNARLSYKLELNTDPIDFDFDSDSPRKPRSDDEEDGNKNKPEQPFKIEESSGRIYTTRPLDFDTTDKLYQFTAKVSDHGKPIKNDTANVIIQILDQNDNRPIFTQNVYLAEIREHGKDSSNILKVQAKDSDSEENSRITYKILPLEGLPFEINRLTGIISIKNSVDPGSIDREKIPGAKFEFTVRATDSGEKIPLSSTAKVIIKVKDINDQHPVFQNTIIDPVTTRPKLVIFIPENSPINQPLAKIVATDADEGINAEITYHLSDREVLPQNDKEHSQNLNKIWRVNYHTGEISSTSNLNYEKQKNYNFIIEARSGTLIATIPVEIKIQDENDNDPRTQKFSVVLNNLIGSDGRSVLHFPENLFGIVPSFDPDVNDTLSFRFDKEPPMLDFESVSGITSQKMRLNRRQLKNNRPLSLESLLLTTDGKHEIASSAFITSIPLKSDRLENAITTAYFKRRKPANLPISLAEYDEIYKLLVFNIAPVVYILDINSVTSPKAKSAFEVSFVATDNFENEQYYPATYVRTLMKLQKATLESRNFNFLKVKTPTFCLSETCENFKVCSDKITFNENAVSGPESTFLKGKDIFLRKIPPIQELACTCPQGFGGDNCDIEMDFCFSAPCMNGGVCISVENGYYCECKPRTSGKNCQNSLVTGRCENLPAQTGSNSRKGLWDNHNNLFDNEQTSMSMYMSQNRRSATNMFSNLNQFDFSGLPSPPNDFSYTQNSPSCSKGALKCQNLLIGGYKCVCPHGYSSLQAIEGDNSFCAQRSINLNGQDSFLVLPSISTKWSLNLEVSFSTWSNNAVLLTQSRVDTDRADYFKIEIVDGRISVTISTGKEKNDRQTIVLNGLKKNLINDGSWHKITVKYKNLPNFTKIDQAIAPPTQNKEILIFIDDCNPNFDPVQKNKNGKALQFQNCHKNVTWKSESKALDFDGPLIIGNSTSLNGCIGNLKINHALVDFNDNILVKNINPGCPMLALDYCTISGIECANGGSCENRLNTAICKCKPGFTGKFCKSGTGKISVPMKTIYSLDRNSGSGSGPDKNICDLLKPCQNKNFQHKAHCTQKSEQTQKLQPFLEKFTCDCPPNRYGKFCEKIRPKICPSGWRGYPICRPCDCDISKNFAPSCNEIDGECQCKEGYYRAPNVTNSADAHCLPCQCHLEGAKSNSCDQKTGQCSCVQKVFGRRCDQCQSRDAEITSEGCKIIYDHCPRNSLLFFKDEQLASKSGIEDSKKESNYLQFARTPNGQTAKTSCPGKLSTGQTTRKCSEKLGWQDPDYSQCTSKYFADLEEKFSKNGNGINTENSVQLLENLRQSSAYFIHDQEISADKLTEMLKFQSIQSGYDLSMTREHHFNTDLVQIVSNISVVSIDEFKMVDLISSLGKYTSNIAKQLGSINQRDNTVFERSDVITLSARPLGNPISLDKERERSIEDPQSIISNYDSTDVNFEYQTNSGSVHITIPSILNDINYSIGYLIIETPLLTEKLPLDMHTFTYDWVMPPRPVLNSAVVSLTIHSKEIETDDKVRQSPEREFGLLNNQTSHRDKKEITDMPEEPLFTSNLYNPTEIMYQFKLINSAQRSRPSCVIWRQPGWTETVNCRVSMYNNTHVTCACLALQANNVMMVLMDTGSESALLGAESKLFFYIPLMVSFSLLRFWGYIDHVA